VGLDWPVAEINGRINERVKRMFKAGFVEEVMGLLSRGRLTRQAIEAVGYREVTRFLEGRSTLEDAIEQTKIRSRRLGKQQRTWLRRFRLISDSIWMEGALPTEALSERIHASLVIGHDKLSP